MLESLKQNYKILALGTVLVAILALLVCQDFIFGGFFVLFLALTILLFDKQKFVLILIILTIIIGQLVRLSVPGAGEETGGAILISDIFVPALVLFWLINTLAEKKNIAWGAIDSLLLLFLAVATLSFVWSTQNFFGTDLLVSFFYLLRLLSYAALFFVTKDLVRSDQNFAKTIIITVLTVAFFLSLLGFLQLIFFPSLAELAKSAGWDPHFKRIFSTFLDPNFFGVFLSVSIAIITAFFFELKKEKEKILFFIFWFVIALCLYFTYSRSAYLGAFISFFVITFFKSKRVFIWGLIIFASIVLLSPKIITKITETFHEDRSGIKRLINWQKTFKIAKDYSLTGVGFNNLRLARKNYDFSEGPNSLHSASGSDSSFLLILVTTGVFGVLTLFLFYISVVVKSYRLYRSGLSPPFVSAFSLSIFSIFVGLFFTTQFINAFFYPHLMIPIFMLTGALFGLKADKERQSQKHEK